MGRRMLSAREGRRRHALDVRHGGVLFLAETGRARRAQDAEARAARGAARGAARSAARGEPTEQQAAPAGSSAVKSATLEQASSGA